MYDPTIGQFISEDPIDFEAGDPNLRRYVGNSPTNATDPSGLKARLDEGTIGAMKRIFGAENLTIDGNIVSFSNPEAAAIASYKYVQDTNGSMAFRNSLWKAIADSDTFSLNDIVSGQSDAILAPPSNPGPRPSPTRETCDPNSVSAFVHRQRATGLGRDEMYAGPLDSVIGYMTTADGRTVPLTKYELSFQYQVDLALQMLPTIGVFIVGEAIPGPADEAAALRALRGARTASSPRLIHLTDDAGQAGITLTGTIKGSHGIFAVPSHVAQESTALKVLRTGLTPARTTNAVPIPSEALKLFQRPVPVGPYSGWKYFGGVRYAPAGTLDTATGTLTPSSPLIGPKVLVYGPDGVFYVGIATAGGLYVYGETGTSK